MIRIRRNSSLTAAGVQEVLISDTDDMIAIGDGTGDSCMDTANDALRVNVVAGAGGGVSATDDAAFTLGSSMVPIGGIYRSTVDPVDANDSGVFHMTINRALHVNLRDNSGAELTTLPISDGGGTVSIDDGGGIITVDGTVAATQSGTWNITNVSGTISLPTGAATLAEQQSQSTSLSLLDDVIFVDNAAYNDDTDKVAVTGGVYDSAPTTLASGDAGYFLLDASHRQQMVLATELPAGTQNIGDVDILSIAAGDNNIGNVDIASIAAGDNNIGNVDVVTLPAIPAGNNNIGDVDVASLPGTVATDITAIKTAVEILDNAVSGSEVQVDVVTMPTVAVTNTPLTNLATALTSDGSDSIDVNIIGGAGSGGTAMTDEAAFTLTGTSFTPIGGIAQTATGDTLSNGNAGVVAMTTTRAMHVYIKGTDVGAAGGTSMTDDAAFTVASTSFTPIGGVYNSTPDTLSDGDGGAFQMTSERALFVHIRGTDVGAAGGTSMADSAAVTAGSTNFTPMGGYMDDASSDALAEGEGGIVRMTSGRAIHSYIAGQAADLTVATHAVTQSGTWNVTNVSGTVSLPTGAATETTLAAVLVDTGQIEALLTTIDADTGSIMTAVQLIDNAISGSEMQVDVVASLPAGTNNIGDVDVLTCALPTGASTLAEQQTQTTALQLIDDIIFADNAAYNDDTDKVAVMGGVYDSAPTALTSGDAGYLLLDADHAQQVVLRAGTAAFGKLSANSGVDIGDVDVTSVTCAAANAKVDIGLINAVTPLMGAGNTGTGSLRVTIATDQATVAVTPAGNVAHDTADSGNPLKIGGKARTTNPTAVADADRVDATFDDIGRQVVVLNQVRDLVVHQATTITSSTTETTILTAAASTFHDLTSLIITNSSATALIVTLKDDTGGTTRGIYAIAANGGIVINFPTPLTQSATNDNWTLTCGTSVASIYVQVVAVKNV